jgi:hypothetical protein
MLLRSVWLEKVLWLCLFSISFYSSIYSANVSAATSKPNLVLLPIDVSEQDSELEAEYGAALQEGLQNRYTVFYGASVEKELEKEYSKIDCDTETCNQNIAIAFNGELIADGAVKRIAGGYLLKLVVSNVLTNQVVETRTQPCEGCNQFAVMRNLTLMGAGNHSNTKKNTGLQIKNSSPNATSNPSNSSQRTILIFDSQPTGANISINGKPSGKTPYQGLGHSINELLNIELSHASYEKASLTLQLQQAITQLEPIQLKLGTGNILIASEPYKSDAVVYINGEAKGVAPLQLTLAAGSHKAQIKVGKENTQEITLNVLMGDNDPIKLPFIRQKNSSASKVQAVSSNINCNASNIRCLSKHYVILNLNPVNYEQLYQACAHHLSSRPETRRLSGELRENNVGTIAFTREAVKEDQGVWTYNPSEKRVRRSPDPKNWKHVLCAKS